MKNRAILTAAVLIATIGAFIAGRSSAPASTDTDSSSSGIPQRRGKIEAVHSSTFAPSKRSSARNSAHEEVEGAGSFRLDSPEEEMRRIVETVDPMERAQAWLDFISTLDPDQFESVVAEFRQSGFTRNNMAEYKMLLTAWAKNDPLAALDYAEANTGNSIARNTILTSWATSDPEAAISWAKEHHDGKGANRWMVGVIRGLAAADPVRATELMVEMPRSEERGEALDFILPSILGQGKDAAKAWISTITDDSLRNGAVRRVAEDFARDDPRGTADWLADNQGEGANATIDNVMGIWAGQDQSAATSYYNGLPSGDLRTNALRGITNHMASNDPKAASDFLDAHARDANDSVYQQFIWHSAGDAPAIAANYIGQIKDTGDRDSMYRRMLDRWLRRDYDSAATWINSNNLPAEVSKRVGHRMEEIQQSRQ